MKFRTDFVTNSSSSSYCVSFRVNLIDNKTIWFQPEDEESYAHVPLNISVGELTGRIKDCKKIEELRQLLLDEWDLSKLSEYDDEDEYDDENSSSNVLEEYEEFKEKLDSIRDISDVESVTISEMYSGWGECATEGIRNFIFDAIPEKLDWNDEDAVFEALEDRFSTDEIELLIKEMQDSFICSFDASIDTKIRLSDGTITNTYSFEER